MGIFDHRCPHRCASLFFGRNEENGKWCVYHGWKFGVTSQCVDTPSEPADNPIRNKVRARAYPTRERGGVVWVYMGRSRSLPELPPLDADLLPEGHRWVKCGMCDCNWLQALEGDIDPTHLSFLYLGAMSENDFPVDSPLYHYLRVRAPRFDVTETACGAMYGTYRPTGKGENYWRIAQFLMPFWTMSTGDPLGPGNVLARAWVHLDDEHAMFWHLSRPIPTRPPVLTQKDGKELAGIHFDFERFLPDTSDWLGRNRYELNALNDNGLDRGLQRTRSYTGIDCAHIQDQATTESMGAIVDRTREHLGNSDEMIIVTGRKLLCKARALKDEQALPSGVANPEIYAGVLGGEMRLAPDADWLDAYREKSARRTDTHESAGAPGALVPRY